MVSFPAPPMMEFATLLPVRERETILTMSTTVATNPAIASADSHQDTHRA
jgi:hypothetical protein